MADDDATAVKDPTMLKVHVRDQHRKLTKWNFIFISFCQGVTNFVIIWGIVHSSFDENIIKEAGDIAFFTGFVIFPNIVFALPPRD